jgi:hypothetical protein
VRLSAAASSSVRPALAGPARAAFCLGATPAALYLQVTGRPGVLALLARDAVRLPCALLLPTTKAECPLDSLAPAAEYLVGDDQVAWTGPAGPVAVRVVREWAPATVRRGTIVPAALAALRACLPAPAAVGIDGSCLPLLTADPPAAVARLLGCGPGLTPAGDDVLAGFLVGAAAFGSGGAPVPATTVQATTVPAAPVPATTVPSAPVPATTVHTATVQAATAALAPARTTALSAALLWHAARGECIDELAAVTAFLTQPDSQNHAALGRLMAVGHTSGAALALGLAAASRAALRADVAGRAAA